MSDVPEQRYSGSAVVIRMVLAAVGVAALVGFVLGAVVIPQRVSGDAPIAHVGPVSFAITPLTMAAYGVVSIGLVLLAGLWLVRAVSDRYATEA